VLITSAKIDIIHYYLVNNQNQLFARQKIVGADPKKLFTLAVGLNGRVKILASRARIPLSAMLRFVHKNHRHPGWSSAWSRALTSPPLAWSVLTQTQNEIEFVLIAQKIAHRCNSQSAEWERFAPEAHGTVQKMPGYAIVAAGSACKSGILSRIWGNEHGWRKNSVRIAGPLKQHDGIIYVLPGLLVHSLGIWSFGSKQPGCL
jgi:hypothetical protein